MTPPAEVRFRVGADHDASAGDRRRRAADQMVVDLESLTSELVVDMGRFAASDGAVESLCAGWTVRDVVLHLVTGDTSAAKVLGGENPFTDPTHDEDGLQAMAKAWVAELGDLPVAESVARFEAARQQMLAAIATVTPDQWRERVPWGAMPISRFAMVQSRLMETWVHGWDIRWPLGIDHGFDDRAWWVADMGVRHVPYALMKQQREVPDAALAFALDGPAGGSWSRELGAGGEEISIEGPAWAWVAWSTQRAPGRVGASALRGQPSDRADAVIDTARCFA